MSIQGAVNEVGNSIAKATTVKKIEKGVKDLHQAVSKSFKDFDAKEHQENLDLNKNAEDFAITLRDDAVDTISDYVKGAVQNKQLATAKAVLRKRQIAIMDQKQRLEERLERGEIKQSEVYNVKNYENILNKKVK